MATVNYNERSWAIDLITDINLEISKKNISIKRAGGENTLKHGAKSLFPDVLLFGDLDKGRILQGWELKMPDTPIDDTEFIQNAKIKAELLSLDSFLLWNVSCAVLYKIENDGRLEIIKSWNNLAHIKTRVEVIQNTKLINAMLIEILEDLNTYISSGKIKSTSVVTALSSEAVSELIQRNLSGYVESLKNFANSDTAFADEVTLWWRYAKNDYPEEKNKFIVLGRNNLLSLVNKFLFAHVLKSYQSDAGLIDSINYDSCIKSALVIFKQISEKCDFWNIFQDQKGEELLTDEVWYDIISFNNLLKEFVFSKIDKSLLHDLIGLTIYRNKRKFAGQFSTPPELAKFIAQLTIKNKNLPAIDPCCGTGTIAKEIYNFKKAYIGVEMSIGTLWASDKFSLPLQMAMFNLADPEALGYVIKVFKQDATKLTTGQEIELHEPFKGTLIKEALPKFGYIISNLPFVQQKDLAVLNPNVSEINLIIVDKLGADFKLDGRSDLYAYLPFYFWELLDSTGLVSIIVSNSWLGTSWGQKWYMALSGFFHIESIVTSARGRWFDNAKVVTNIIILKKKDIPTLPEEEEVTKFITTKKRLGEYTTEDLGEITTVISNRMSVDETDISINSFSHAKISKIQDLGLNLNSFFSNTEWILELDDKLVKISELFNIRRGERRGWDKLFYPSIQNNIETTYLKPFLKTPRSIKNLIAKSDAVAFCCEKTKDELKELGHFGALEWINKFESQNNGTGVPLPTSLAQHGINWYTMVPSMMAEIVTNINFGKRLFFARCEEPTFLNQRLVGFSSKSIQTDSELCHALLNSSISLFYVEAMGTGRGEGALDLTKNKIESDLRIINPILISPENRTKIISLFKVIENRGIFSIHEELERDDRNAFDNAVLESVGCLEYKEKIKKALLDLYKIRMSIDD